MFVNKESPIRTIEFKVSNITCKTIIFIHLPRLKVARSALRRSCYFQASQFISCCVYLSGSVIETGSSLTVTLVDFVENKV